jgi:hypothetical protein
MLLRLVEERVSTDHSILTDFEILISKAGLQFSSQKYSS